MYMLRIIKYQTVLVLVHLAGVVQKRDTFCTYSSLCILYPETLVVRSNMNVLI